MLQPTDYQICRQKVGIGRLMDTKMIRNLIFGLVLFQLAFAAPVMAISQADLEAIHNDTYFFDQRAADDVTANGVVNLPTGPVAGLGGCYDTTLFSIKSATGLASAINSYIKKRSPSNGNFFDKGDYFVAAGIKNGVNPLWELAIALHESSFGSNGIAVNPGTDEQGRAGATSFNAYGRTATPQQPHISYGGSSTFWYRWENWEVSIEGEAQYLKEAYINDPKVGASIRAAQYKYTPDGTTEGYILAINGTIDEVVADAGSAVSCNDASGETAVTNPTAFSSKLINLANGTSIVETLHNMRQLVVSWFIK
jgi:hypothetical protein